MVPNGDMRGPVAHGGQDTETTSSPLMVLPAASSERVP